MLFSRILLLPALLTTLVFTSVAFADFESLQKELDELESEYTETVAKSGKMSEEAQELRSEIVDTIFDMKHFPKAVPYLRESWAYIEQEGIKGKEKGRLRYRLGKALRIAGYAEEADPLLQESCERTKDKKGEQSRPALKRCLDYAINLTNLGRGEEAIEIMKKTVEYSEVTFGENNGRTAYAHLQLGAAYARSGIYKPAKKHIKIALELFIQKKGTTHRLTNLARFKLATVYRATGDFDKAERILRRAYTDFASKKKNQNHQIAFHLMSYLGRVLRDQGRYAEAEKLLIDSIEGKKRVLGVESNKTIYTMLTLANIYLDQNKAKEAEQVMIEIDKVDDKVIDESRFGIRRDLIMARTQLKLNKLDEAEKFFLKAKGNLAKSDYFAAGFKHFANKGLGRTYYKQGKYDKAEPLLLEAEKISSEYYGEHNPKTSSVREYIAQNYTKKKQFDKAITYYRQIMQSNADFLSKQEVFSNKGRAQQEAAAQKHLFSYMKLMVNAYQKGIKVDADPVPESFAIAENSRSKSLQTAMLGQTARAAARNDYLSELVRREQDIRVRIGEIEEEQIQFVTSANATNRKQGRRLEEERRELIRELKKIGEEMSYQYPEYNRLVNPQATSLTEVQKLLAPGELMLAYFVQKENTLIWAIDKDKATLHVSKLAEKDILARVQRIRAGLDLPIATLEDIPAYNTQIAYELYQELIAPAGKQLASAKSLIIVPHRALLSMPFGALLTSPTKLSKGKLPFEEYKTAPWLSQKYALSIMPSATALVTMRTFAKREPAEEPFIGFGDPIFSPHDDRPAAEVATRGIRVAQRAVINTRSLNGLPNLPETRDELKNIALTLGAGEDNLYLGENASEINVKNTSLKDYRVVAFATHGLVAGDLDGLEQPALALTPPEEATEENDGLLQMGEVLGLELNADWVVLSACNTASGDKNLANEGLTGLTQAFFYAGSKALLVSLWPVESTSTQNLTTAMFDAAKKDDSLSRAASLQAARKRLIEGQGYMYEGKEVFSYAHPIFWSAFIAVGEGGSN